MKITWLCIWLAFAVIEVALTLWSHSAVFLAIGAVIPAMIAWNLHPLGLRAAAPVVAELPQPGALIS